MLAILFMQINESIFDQMLYQNTYQDYYEHMTIEYLNIVLPILIVMISMHHESTALWPLYAYFGKSKVTIYKMISYLIFIIWTYLFLLIPIFVLPSFLTVYFIPSTLFLLKLMMVFLQNLIILICVFMFIHQKYQNFAMMLSIFSILYHMLYQDSFRLYLFYILPYYHQDMLQYKYHLIYQCFYILLGLWLSYMKMVKKEIT
ncbi:hypothetical protein KHQ89_05290 [Mycoplasmatota bacterium]|nr:hypothetical protein KHQ89_05290 [Mycoplasmatota bacterium]